MWEQIRTTRNLIIIVVLLAGIACLSSGITLLSLQCEPEEHPKLSSYLNRLVQAEAQGEAEEFAQQKGIELLYDDAGLISVEVITHCFPGRVEAAIEVAETYGTVEAKYLDDIQVVVPIVSLVILADEESIEYIELPVYAVSE